jgi:hypothetical protein
VYFWLYTFGSTVQHVQLYIYTSEKHSKGLDTAGSICLNTPYSGQYLYVQYIAQMIRQFMLLVMADRATLSMVHSEGRIPTPHYTAHAFILVENEYSRTVFTYWLVPQVTSQVKEPSSVFCSSFQLQLPHVCTLHVVLFGCSKFHFYMLDFFPRNKYQYFTSTNNLEKSTIIIYTYIILV